MSVRIDTTSQFFLSEADSFVQCFLGTNILNQISVVSEDALLSKSISREIKRFASKATDLLKSQFVCQLFQLHRYLSASRNPRSSSLQPRNFCSVQLGEEESGETRNPDSKTKRGCPFENSIRGEKK